MLQTATSLLALTRAHRLRTHTTTTDCLHGVAAAAAGQQQTPQLWHERFGHIGYTSLAKTLQHDAVTGISLTPQQLEAASAAACEPCILAKQHKVHRPSSATKTTLPLELLHMLRHSLPVKGPFPSLFALPLPLSIPSTWT